jgi:hypothetical protein
MGFDSWGEQTEDGITLHNYHLSVMARAIPCWKLPDGTGYSLPEGWEWNITMMKYIYTAHRGVPLLSVQQNATDKTWHLNIRTVEGFPGAGEHFQFDTAPEAFMKAEEWFKQFLAHDFIDPMARHIPEDCRACVLQLEMSKKS